ncbi:unnamed protein product [Pseudo-nitzschia multistriata]|uniref:Uncharacterized protein n=1 Tax=Pseudo-nitzschia multistriata TaxID=183589 RepID=A0A448YUY4_9STRA|nr:unnamed protein product [Pseudo-nitzschia multistriata]
MKVTPNMGLQGLGIAVGTMVVLAFLTAKPSVEREVRVAMIGNSLMYYNDLPRLLEAMSNGRLSQDSCLHGSASLKSHLYYGNGMFVKWDTGNARIWNVDNADYEGAAEAYTEYMDYYNGNNGDDGNNYDDDAQQQQQYTYQLDSTQSHIYDFGACTVPQLLLGRDERLVEKYSDNYYTDDYNEDDLDEDEDYDNDDNNDNGGNQRHQRQLRRERARRRMQHQSQRHETQHQLITRPSTETQSQSNLRVLEQTYHYTYAADDAASVDDFNNNNNADDEYNTYSVVDSFTDTYALQNDGKNPCLLSANYYFFKQSQYDEFNGGVPKWDYILINDMSRGPCCTTPRAESMELLVDVYVPWILKTGAVPVFMVTHAYWPSTRDMSGLTDIPTFMSLTYEGYREYAEAISIYLPEHQQPKLAPVGLAFLLVWEENPTMWANLIHMDEIHLTPTGTYLEGLIVYATLYGHLPSPRVVLNENIANLFSNARRMTPSEHIQEAYPTLDNARYLYHIASRIMNGALPRSFKRYSNGESVDFEPNDSSSSSSNNNNNNNN